MSDMTDALDAAFAGVVADLFTAEADHWEAEYRCPTIRALDGGE